MTYEEHIEEIKELINNDLKYTKFLNDLSDKLLGYDGKDEKQFIKQLSGFFKSSDDIKELFKEDLALSQNYKSFIDSFKRVFEPFYRKYNKSEKKTVSEELKSIACEFSVLFKSPDDMTDTLNEEWPSSEKKARWFQELAFTLLKGDDEMEFSDGENIFSISRTQMFLNAIDLDKTLSNSYLALKLQLKEGEKVRLNDKRALNAKELVLEAITHSPYQSLPYGALAFFVSDRETIPLPNGTEMNQNELLIESVALDRNYVLHDFRNEYKPDNDEMIKLPDGRKFNQIGFLEAFVKNRSDLLILCGLILTMKPCSKIIIPTSWPEKEFDKEGNEIKIDIKKLKGDEVKREELISGLLKGVKEAEENRESQELILSLIEGTIDCLKKRSGDSGYEDASETIIEGDNEIKSNDKMSKRDIEAFVYWTTTLSINPDEEIEDKNGNKWDHKKLIRYAINNSPREYKYYLFAGLYLNQSEELKLGKGFGYRPTDLLRTALFLNPESASAYIGLGYRLYKDESLVVMGRKMTQQQLFLKAAEINPDMPKAYMSLALTIFDRNENQEPITLDVNGKQMTKTDLFDKYNELNS